jgi:hypothetical protein
VDGNLPAVIITTIIRQEDALTVRSDLVMTMPLEQRWSWMTQRNMGEVGGGAEVLKREREGKKIPLLDQTARRSPPRF